MSLWWWLGLAGLGAFHGVNPAMGWLFAVALGLHQQSRAVVLESLIPIALGHTIAITVVVFVVAGLGTLIDQRAVRLVSGAVLIGWAVYHKLYGSRHRVRFGMRVGLAGLGLWSFLMAMGHGAGLMLVPFLLPPGSSLSARMAGAVAGRGAFPLALAAIWVHTLAMLIATAVVAIVVYEWVGLGFLRRGWINLDLLWSAGLVATGLILLAGALLL
ncbi:MAG TPA: hypothetical protein VMS64_27695 [Candidatus Methylomirabilis sp.]|nr:hypothetical protein [Candidatus Methylomirabilis sp.]